MCYVLFIVYCFVAVACVGGERCMSLFVIVFDYVVFVMCSVFVVLRCSLRFALCLLCVVSRLLVVCCCCC